MTTTTFETRVLTPSEGKHIRNTQTGDIAEYQVFLGANADASIFDEVSEEEYQSWKAAKEEEARNA